MQQIRIHKLSVFASAACPADSISRQNLVSRAHANWSHVQENDVASVGEMVGETFAKFRTTRTKVPAAFVDPLAPIDS